jgi:hypothetical protein
VIVTAEVAAGGLGSAAASGSCKGVGAGMGAGAGSASGSGAGTGTGSGNGRGDGAGTESSPLIDVTRIVGGVPSAVPSAVTTPVTLARNPCRCVPAPVHVLQIPTSRAASMSIILPASSTRKSLV